jgi:uncharacterized repeat protein (TIGR01451 family)
MRTQETTRQIARPSTSKIWRFNGVAAAVAVALGGLAAVPGQAFAAAPAANSTIGNTASATYTDASAVNRTATSNTVNTIVQQVSSFTLVADRTAVVAPGGQVVYSHTLTNTGNGSEGFVLTSGQTTNGAGDQIDLTGFKIYADADGNGVADNATDLTGSTVTLASNGVFKFVVVGSAPGTAVAGNTAVTTVTATTAVSAFNPAPDALTNTDTATVTADAVITVTKSASVITGPIGTEVQYTLTYTNTGNNTATGVTITDAIPRELAPLMSGMKYKANSGIWSAGGTLTDTNGAADDGAAGINFNVTGAPGATEQVNITIASVAPNVSGTIKFTVRVDDQATSVDLNPVAAPGILTNTASFAYNNGSAPVTAQPTNSVDFTVTQTAAVAANDNPTNNSTDGSPIQGAVLDTVEVASAGQGTVVVFDNYIWNNGNGVDKFNITYANPGANAFPVGTSFQLFQADGVNVLQDTNSDGIPDTGAMAPGASYKVVLKATLPANATNTGAPFNVIKTATSVIDPTKTDFVYDRLLAITSNVVDLANSAANNVLGAGGASDAGAVAGGAGVNGAWTTTPINPGATATFPLYITNKVGQADNYNLSADNDSNNANAVAFPAGWTVVFRSNASGVCATTGATITNTGTINAGAQTLVCAVVTVPATQTPIASQDVYFRALSPVTGVEDKKLDAVTVNTFRNIQMTSDNTGQVFPGGSVVYTHIVTNNGNVVEGSASGEITFTGVNTLAGTGFSTVFYIDTNNDGNLDVGDQAITASNFQTLTTAGAVGNGIAGLSPAESVRIFAKVQAPASATPGTTDAATITAVVTGAINTIAAPTSPVNTDTTNVIGGQIRLDKTQSLDADCNGTSDSGVFAVSNINALPGACIMYSIFATNEGVSAVTGITINDATPAFTKLAVTPSPAPAIVVPVTSVGATTGISTNLATGALGATVDTLNGGATATFSFSVKIDQ